AARIIDWGGSKPRAGYIDVSVFRENPDGEEMKAGRTLRSISSHSRAASRPANLKDARAAVAKRASGSKGLPPKRKGRGLIVESGNSEDNTLETAELKNPAQVYQMQINYYTPPAVTP